MLRTMASKFFLALATLLLCLPGQFPATNAQVRKPQTFTTPAKAVTAYLLQSGQAPYEIRGQAAFTVTAANSDDTLTGTFVYTLPDAARQKIATLAAQPLNQIPALLAQKEVRATFQKETGCPLLHWELAPEELEIVGVKIHFKRVVLDVPETRDHLTQLFCHWARQISVNRQRRGLIAAVNRALNGDEESEELKEKSLR
jgi:hypothetical protein